MLRCARDKNRHLEEQNTRTGGCNVTTRLRRDATDCITGNLVPPPSFPRLPGRRHSGRPALRRRSAGERAGHRFAKTAPLDLSSGDTGWVSAGGEWIAKPGSPPPVGFDPAHPYVPNNIGKQPTFRIADLNNPNLTQFAKDGLKKSNDEVLAGKAMYSREARCWATGVPVYLLNPAQPTFFLQTPEKVVMIWQMDQQVRHVYLNVPHSAESQAVLVRRVGRALRGRHPGGRHHRPEHPDLRRQLPHAAQRQAARDRALSPGRRRQGAAGRHHHRGSGRSSSGPCRWSIAGGGCKAR